MDYVIKQKTKFISLRRKIKTNAHNFYFITLSARRNELQSEKSFKEIEGKTKQRGKTLKKNINS